MVNTKHGIGGVKMTNIEKLAAFIDKEGRELLPAFLSLLEVCLYGREHSLEEKPVGFGDVLARTDHAEP